MIILLIVILFLVIGASLIIFFFKISSLLNERIAKMESALKDAQSAISSGLGNATGVFGSVQSSLGRLEETNRQIHEVAKDISSLQELLRAPKMRGQIGETLLENFLSQILPKAYYLIQHRFKNGETVDAAVKLGEKLVPIDAKFSLENFKRILETQDEQEKNSFRKKFFQDVKARIDEIASKYILPQENTYDFALMYVPAENVYYEIITSNEIFVYGMNKKVLAVSPNTFYAYLQVVCLGLKGLKVEENAKEILRSLSALSVEMTKFKDDFSVLGVHISNAGKKFEESQKRIEKVTDRLQNIQETKVIE